MRPGFLTDFHAVKIGRKKWRLVSPLKYRSYVKGYAIDYDVPAGRISDGESVPPIPLVHGFLAEESTLPAGILHDELYCYGMEPRDISDAIYFEALESIADDEESGKIKEAMLTKTLPVAALEIGDAYLERISDALKNLAKWIGVRVGGWFFYKREGE